MKQVVQLGHTVGKFARKYRTGGHGWAPARRPSDHGRPDRGPSGEINYLIIYCFVPKYFVGKIDRRNDGEDGL